MEESESGSRNGLSWIVNYVERFRMKSRAAAATGLLHHNTWPLVVQAGRWRYSQIDEYETEPLHE